MSSRRSYTQTCQADHSQPPTGCAWDPYLVSTKVWAEGWQMACCGEPFTVGQSVTWPLTTRRNIQASQALVGAEVERDVTYLLELHAGPPDTDVPIEMAGIVRSIKRYRCRHSQGQVVPGSVEVVSVNDADGWAGDDEHMNLAGYLVTLDLEGE